MLNQLKRNKKVSALAENHTTVHTQTKTNDLRLETILLVASSTSISKQAKIVFVLKNIFGLSVHEIAENTLIGDQAIYKIVGRSKTALQSEYKDLQIQDILENIGRNEVPIVEEILYAVFNSGFDSFSEKHKSIVNEDLCLESFALAKILLRNYNLQSTSHLLALFCFHIARIRAKVDEGNLISFFRQDQSKWNKDLINLGFHYLKKTDKINKFYIEALIVSKYMSTNSFSICFWSDIAKLYEILLHISPSPIIEINYCFCLHKAQRSEEAIILLEKVENELTNDHIYLSLMKAKILSGTNPTESKTMTENVIKKLNQEIRKKYLLENQFIDLNHNETTGKMCS